MKENGMLLLQGFKSFAIFTIPILSFMLYFPAATVRDEKVINFFLLHFLLANWQDVARHVW